MNAVPKGSMASEKVLIAPVMVAASASSPSGATMRASASPTTDWVERDSTIGQARRRSSRSREGSCVDGDMSRADYANRRRAARSPGAVVHAHAGCRILPRHGTTDHGVDDLPRVREADRGG